jgi:spore coat protein H
MKHLIHALRLSAQVCTRFFLSSFGAIAWANQSPIIINEIMYHPPNDLDTLQYVELFNRGQAEVDLSGWAFTKGIRFAFPPGTKLASGDYLVVCRNLADFTTRYGKEIVAVGDFSGQFSHRGDKLELADAQKNVMDWVKYSDRGVWPVGADGLERICPDAPGEGAENWSASRLLAVKKPGGTPGRRNDSYSTNLPPVISHVEFKTPAPGERAVVTAMISDGDRVASVTLLYRVAAPGRESLEHPVSMKRVSGHEREGAYQAEIDGQPEGTLVRFRLKAVDEQGLQRVRPSENDPCWTYSYYTFRNTNQATVPFGFIINVGPLDPRSRSAGRMFWGMSAPARPEASRGNAAFVYVPPGGGEVQVFDHVGVTPRKGGFKVRFQRDRPFNGMTTINLVFEGSPRYVLSEPLAYELYRLAGVPAPLTDHFRIWMDGRLLGHHLLIEQPNKSFLARNQRDDTGNLYKLLWYGQDIVSKHEKKTNLTTGHDDLLQLIEGLQRIKPAELWPFIEANFNVDEMINYFAVNMCIQNWDGFFNNYFAYHDTGGTGKWEMYPWDEDKTWGDFDGAGPPYNWYEMPLTFGMNGAQPPPLDRNSRAHSFRGPFGGVSWWRHPGYFSGPLLANPEFRKRFLARLREICLTIFTEQKFFPVIDAMQKRLEPEVSLRAQLHGENPKAVFKDFHVDMQSFRNQVIHRRKFILSELDKASPSPSRPGA